MLEACITHDICIFYEDEVIPTYLCQNQTSITYIEEENVLCLYGYVNDDNYGRLFDIEMKDGLQVVAISPGGELVLAARVSEYLEQYDYDIHVNGICASACAQFFFIAANHKFIYRDGVVAMHGGPMTEEQYSVGRSAEEINSIREQMDVFVKFYSDRDIDIDLTRTPPPDVADSISNGLVVFWQPSIKQFSQYGVENISYHLYHPNVVSHLNNVVNSPSEVEGDPPD